VGEKQQKVIEMNLKKIIATTLTATTFFLAQAQQEEKLALLPIAESSVEISTPIDTLSEKESAKIAKPFALKLEHKGLSNQETYTQLQRVDLTHPNVVIKYDYQPQKLDAMQIGFITDDGFGLNMYKVGDHDGLDKTYLEAWTMLDLEKGRSLLIDAGFDLGKNSQQEFFILTNYVGDNVQIGGAIFETAENLTDFKNSTYAYAGVDLGKVYLGAGKNKDELLGLVGTTDTKDLGVFGFGFYNPEQSTWSFSLEGAHGDLNKGFYSKEMFDFATMYLSVPQFFPVQFSPQMARGKYTAKIAGRGTKEGTQILTSVGYTNKVLPIAIGTSTTTTKSLETGDISSQTGLTVQIYKEFELNKHVSGKVEARYNTQTSTLDSYVTICVR
jgi:hypothetical protein